MKAAIFEASPLGHRLNYVRLVAEAIAPYTDDLELVTSDEVIASTQYSVFLNQSKFDFQVQTVLDRVTDQSDFSSSYRRARALQTYVQEHSPDALYVPTADGVLQLLGLTGGVKGRRKGKPLHFEALLMRGKRVLLAKGIKGRLGKYLWRLGLEKCGVNRLHILDPATYELLKADWASEGSLHRIPESASDFSGLEEKTCKKALGLDESARYLGFFGSLNRRKGANLLANALLSAALPSDARVLLMGRVDPACRQDIDKLLSHRTIGSRIELRDEFVSEEELLMGMKSCRIVSVPYPNHAGSSGMLVDAIHCGKFIVATERGWIGRRVKDLSVGITCDVSDVEEHARALSNAWEQEASFNANERATKFRKENCKEAVMQCWASGIEHLATGSAT